MNNDEGGGSDGPQSSKLSQDVADQQVMMTVQLPDGKAVVIEPKQGLKPLPELEGCVPNGWKDALYAHE